MRKILQATIAVALAVSVAAMGWPVGLGSTAAQQCGKPCCTQRPAGHSKCCQSGAKDASKSPSSSCPCIAAPDSDMPAAIVQATPLVLAHDAPAILPDAPSVAPTESELSVEPGIAGSDSGPPRRIAHARPDLRAPPIRCG